jgi:hypothetical protein
MKVASLPSRANLRAVDTSPYLANIEIEHRLPF